MLIVNVIEELFEEFRRLRTKFTASIDSHCFLSFLVSVFCGSTISFPLGRAFGTLTSHTTSLGVEMYI